MSGDWNRDKSGDAHAKPCYALLLAFSALVMASGCRMPGSSNSYVTDTANPFERQQEAEPAVQMASATEPVEPSEQPADLASVLQELDAIGQIDPQAREKLTNDLQGVQPDLWPLMIQQFKSALAYRQQVAVKSESPDSLTAPKPHEPHEPHAVPQVKATPVSYTPEPPAITYPTTPSATVAAPESQKSEPVVISDAASEPSAQVLKQKVSLSTPLPPPPVTTPARPVSAMYDDATVRNVAYTSAVGSDTAWNEDLDAAVSKLQASVNGQPANTAEMHEHMKLRLMQLMAGQRGEAMVPIPGASPALQDYWSKQLFAISTHLDHEQQPDEKRRVSSSLYHLDQARAKLAELATLQVRNMNLVQSVNGFGSYQLRESNEFRPGEPVSLYAEVENLQSESTPEGYRALLSTSYEVVDISGQRVDGRQFPDVEDFCKNPRRDFHMQYGVTLPERIYPGEYQLRLTITDQLSHKIGHASVPFVIVE